MSSQIQITGETKVKSLTGVLVGTSGVVSSLNIDGSLGIPQLDVNGKILVSQLPNSVMEYKGVWNAATNSPTLTNGGAFSQGDVYLCDTAGTVNFGAGPIAFVVSDQVIYSGSIWQKASGTNGTVTSVGLSTNAGAITIGSSPITTSGTITANFNGTNLQYVNGAGNLTTFPTLITSIGLSMPSAFSVANSPLTANGTIAVTGAGVASQYIRGDGTLADFPSSGGGGSSVSYYLNGGTSQGTIGGTTYYEMSKTAVIGTGVDFTKTGDGFIVAFLTDANDPAQLNIPAGNWNYEIYASMSSNGGTPEMYAELYVYDGTTFTLISTSPHEILYDGTALNLYTFAMAVPATSLTLTDRLAVKIYATNSGGKTTTIHTQDSHLCQIITTFSTGITALNGLTAQVQYFQVGTSGTDFNISSTTATHTFNIPDASATARGLITTGTQTIAGAKTFTSKIFGGDDNATNGSNIIWGNYVDGALTTFGSMYSSGGPVIGYAVTPSKTADNSFLSATSIAVSRGAYYVQGGTHIWYYGATQTVAIGLAVSMVESMRLNASGNLILYGTATATSFIKTGGTLSQFLKADGSVDSSAYITLTSLSASTGISYNNTTGVITNSAPDQVVAITASTGISVTGTYPNFTITNTSPSSGGTVTSVAALTLGTTGTDLSSTVATGTTTPVITLNVPTASATNRGALASADWSTFNSKQGTITLTTTGTSGAATFSANTLNIPDYGSALSGYLPLTGGTLTGALNGTSATFSGNISITKDNPKLILNDNAGGSQNNYSISSNFGIFNLNDETASGASVMSYGGGLFNFIGATTFSSTITATAGIFSTITSITNGDQSGARLTIANTGSGGQSINLIAGNPNVDNTGFSIAYGNTNFLRFTSTGEATFTKDITIDGIKVGQGSGTSTASVAFGIGALYANTTGYANAAMGYAALTQNTTGYANTALGSNAMNYNSTGYSNTAVGNTALSANQTGYENTAIGHQAGDGAGLSSSNISSNNCIFIGYLSKASANGVTNEIVIGNGAKGNGSNTITLGNTAITDVITQGSIKPLTSNISSLGSSTKKFYELWVGDINGAIATFSGKVFLNTTTAYTSELNVQAIANNRPAIKAGYGGVSGNGYWILGDNYTTDESLMAIGVDYSSGGLVLGSALAPSTTTSGAFISTQAQFGGYGSAIKLGTGGDIIFYNGTQNSTISVGSAKNASVALTIAQTGAATFSNLAGTGSRAVLADASGTLSAPVSDISVKQNIKPIGYGLNEISKMNPVWFDFIDGYKNFGEGRQNGNIAQEMEAIIPEAVFTTPSTGKMGINYDQLHAVYIKAIQELKAEIEELKQLITE